MKKAKLKKELKKSNKQITQLNKDLETKEQELENVKKLLSFYQLKRKGKELLNDAKLTAISEKDCKKIEILEESLHEHNYRDFITKDIKGNVIIDIQQMILDEK